MLRWEHEHVLEDVQRRLDENPEAMRTRRETVEHPFGTIKARMGATHFLMKGLKNVKTGQKSTLDISGIFVTVGFRPNTDYLKNIIDLAENGTIITNEKMETNVPGILAAGDIRANSIRQVAAAVGDGAVAAIYAERHITGK